MVTVRATISFPATEISARTTCLVLGSSERRLAALVSFESLADQFLTSNPSSVLIGFHCQATGRSFE